MSEHLTVLKAPAVEALLWDRSGFYVDGTFGRGGHSRAILAGLADKGRLLGIDKDPQAIAQGLALMEEDSRFAVAQGSFAEFSRLVASSHLEQPEGLSGVLLDLGVSSPQLDQAERGFSFLRDGALDMRMDTTSGQSAAQWLAGAKAAEIAQVLKEFGEERFAKRIAGAIVKAREETEIVSTLQLAKIVSEANPAWEKNKHPATRAFQAIRIFINNELGDLEQLLDQVVDGLAIGGRLVVISFHSLEDRLVKRFMRKEAKGDQLPAYLPVTEAQRNCRLRLVGKAIKPGDDEIAINPRARSAVMRVAERIA